MVCIMTKPSETHSVKSLWARMSPDQAKAVYCEQKDVEDARVEAEERAAEVSETAIPQQSSHNSLCIGFSSWLLVGSKPADNHNETPMHRELCDDCWGIAAPDRQPAQLERHPRLAGRAPTPAPTFSSTSSQQSCATWARRHFWGRFWFCSCCFCSLESVSAMIATEFKT